MQQKYELQTWLTYFWYKNEKKVSINFIFVFESLRFHQTCLAFYFQKFLIITCGGGQLLFSGSQTPILRVPCPSVALSSCRVLSPGSQVSRSQALGPSFWGLGSRVSRLRVLGRKVPCPRSEMLILDYGLSYSCFFFLHNRKI